MSDHGDDCFCNGCWKSARQRVKELRIRDFLRRFPQFIVNKDCEVTDLAAKAESSATDGGE